MINKIHVKLITVVLTLALSLVLLISTSYAWLVLSNNPAAVGIQVSIGGSSTVKIAPDIRVVSSEGEVYHYPGYFSDEMNFADEASYTYLTKLGALTPVSTVNGVDWILPTYYSGSDEAVQKGEIASGAIKDVTEFYADSELMHANLSKKEDAEDIEKGHYAYLDFWVVSPGEGYKLRVSTDVENPTGGTYVTELLELAQTDTGETTTKQATGITSAVRLGFLANDLMLTDDSMRNYVDSKYFDEQYTRLKGFYQEPDTGTAYMDANRFTIYEPNGDVHPADESLEGLYLETKPLGLTNGVIAEQSMFGGTLDNTFLTVQKTNGAFIGLTANLKGVQSQANGLSLDGIQTAGATDDVYIIELEKNVPQRIRMFIWLEGQDADCTEQIAEGSFAVNIELACGNQ